MSLGASGNEVRAGGAFVDISIREKEFKKGLKSILVDLKTFGKEIGKIGIAMSIAGGLATKTFLDFAKMAAIQTDAETRRATALKSTRNVVGLTVKSLNKMSLALEDLTSIGGEVIADSQAILLTFTSIGKRALPQALLAAANMAAFFKGDMKAASIQLGKALQDPVLGVIALRKAGVSLSPAMREIISNLVASNKLYEAQSIILKELNKEFGDQAAAFERGFLGQIQQMIRRIDELKEAIGFALIPEVLKYARAIREAVIEATKWVEANTETVVAIAKLVFTIGRLGALITAVSAAILLFLNPLSIVAGAIIAFSATWLDSQGLIDAGIKKLLNNFSFFGKTLSQHFETIKLKVKELVAFIQLQVAFGARRIALTLNNAIVDYLKSIENTNALTKKLFAGLSGGSALLGKNQFAQQSEEIDKLRKNLKGAREELKGFNSHVEGLNSATGVRSLTDIFQSVGAAFKRFKENLKKPLPGVGGGGGGFPSLLDGGGIGGVPEAGGVTGFFGSQNIREQAGAFESSTVRIGNKQLEVQRQIARDMAILRQNSVVGKFVEGVGAVFA